MTVLTVELPDFTSPGGRADRIRFQDTTAGLIDATALRTLAGDAIITRMQINGDQDRCLDADSRYSRRSRQVMSEPVPEHVRGNSTFPPSPCRRRG